jgi:hypothetical protein
VDKVQQVDLTFNPNLASAGLIKGKLNDLTLSIYENVSGKSELHEYIDFEDVTIESFELTNKDLESLKFEFEEDHVVTIPGEATPELSTWAMMLLGFAGLGFAGWRASRRSVAFAG